MGDGAELAEDRAQQDPRFWEAFGRHYNREGEMYVYRVAVIIENPETQVRMRREYRVKASRMALATQRAVDYDPRVKSGRQGQDVGILVSKLGSLEDFPQESEVRPLRVGEMEGVYDHE